MPATLPGPGMPATPATPAAENAANQRRATGSAASAGVVCYRRQVTAAARPALPGPLVAWCVRWLGARPKAVLLESGHLSRVIGVRLDDGREVVLKIRPTSARVYACAAVQAALAANGFPCPHPLAEPHRLTEPHLPGGTTTADGIELHGATSPTSPEPALVTAEELVARGEPLGLTPDAPRLFAELLAELVRLAPRPDGRLMLTPSPPWVGWDRKQASLWPVPDDCGRDLNTVAGPGWLDDAAHRARASLRQFRAPPVIGHADWESQNIRWTGHRPLAVHDWDSLAAQPEAAIVGAAAAVWPADGDPDQAATVEQSEEFLAAYQRARNKPWTAEERRLCWAAGIWVRAFNAKKDAASGGGPQLQLLSQQIAARLHHAGLGHPRP
jgi:hypothetical protein